MSIKYVRGLEAFAVAVSYAIVGTLAGIAVFLYVACIFHG
jgi:hypothetical protein